MIKYGAVLSVSAVMEVIGSIVLVFKFKIKFIKVVLISVIFRVIGQIEGMVISILSFLSSCVLIYCRPLRHPLMFAFFTYVVGNILYVVAWDSGYWVLVVSRGIAGTNYDNITNQYSNHTLN